MGLPLHSKAIELGALEDIWVVSGGWSLKQVASDYLQMAWHIGMGFFDTNKFNPITMGLNASVAS